ncbi:MAG TPA: glycine cleavage system aminomethyltransferase GcvT [Meiothermus sp.]|jgi:aminomethyltransferase|nr:glycine cleavage system aminomethyltransferase GcvT [Meiothermus sp.]
MKTTPLTSTHQGLGAKMAPFAGYLMPIQYSSITAEHLAVREGAGVFDVSHMGEFWVRGEKALDFLQYATLNDASKLKVGRAQYSMLPNEQGGVVDDIYVYRTGDQEYLVVVNASNIEKDWNHLQSLLGGFEADLEDASEHTGLLAVQGPKAAEVLQKLCDVDLSSKKKNDTFTATVAGKPARLARTGYTGEDGFEVFTEAGDVKAVWDALLEAGVVPCGLGARDTLRLEAGFPLYGHELTDETNPRCTPFGWVVKEHKEFYGKAALLAGGCDQVLVGLLLEQGIPREGYLVLFGGEAVGRVTSGTISPLLKKGIALAYVRSGAESGRLEVEIRGKTYPAQVVSPPFVGLK